MALIKFYLIYHFLLLLGAPFSIHGFRCGEGDGGVGGGGKNEAAGRTGGGVVTWSLQGVPPRYYLHICFVF